MASDMTVAADPESYWHTVEDCLVELHRMKRHEARRRLSNFRMGLEVSALGRHPELVYHAEQFDIACTVAGRQLDRKEYQDAYDQIVVRYYATAGQEYSQAQPIVNRINTLVRTHEHVDAASEESEGA
jgi:hypothetical protein